MSGFNFALGDSVELLRDSVKRFAEKEIAPFASQIDRENLFPHPIWRKFGYMGLLGITVEEEYGGSDLGYLAHVVARRRSLVLRRRSGCPTAHTLT